MRTFIAIGLPETIRDSLAGTQERLKNSGADVKWVEPANIHLTLKFLGEADNGKLPEVILILEDVIKDKKVFQVSISSIGSFPRINSPRVIWVGTDKGSGETKKIAEELEEKLVKIGIPKEDRAFQSHITIGRIRSTLNREQLAQDLNNLVNKFSQENLIFYVTSVSLFKSTLTPKGPIYEVVKEVSLQAT